VAEPNASKASGHATVLLRLLSGPQQGAEVRLGEETSYLIGSDDECDIVLQAESIAPRHLAVTARQGQLHLEARDQAVITAERTLQPGQTSQIPAGAVIRLGEIHIGLGPENTDWNQVVWPAAEKKPDEAPGQEAPPVSAVDESPPPMQDVPPAQSSPSPPSPPSPPSSPPSSPSRSAGRRWLALGGIAILATLILAAWWWTPLHDWLNGGSATDRTAAETTVVAKAQAIATELGIHGINIAVRPDGGVVLTGYCETRASKSRLSAALRTQGIAADNQLWPEETIRETIAYTLDRLGGKSLRYDYLGKGVLQLHGLLRTGLRHDQLQSTLHNDVPGLDRIESKAKTLEDFTADLRKQVQEAGLDEQIAITATATNITAVGTLDADEMARWEPIARAFLAATQDFLTFDAKVSLIKGSASPLPPTRIPATAAAAPQKEEKKSYGPLRIAVRGIMIGPDQVSYALLDDGTRIAEGDRIDGHYLVEKILFNRVIIRDGAQRKIYYIGEPAHE